MPAPLRTDVLALPATTRRLVVLGDPHGDLLALSEVLAREHGPGVAIVSAGDNIGHASGPMSSDFCRVLEARGIKSVRGNHEEWSASGTLFLSPPGEPRQLTAEALAWCNALPHRLRVEAALAPGLSLSVVHSFSDWSYLSPETAELLLEEEGTTVTFSGHTHRPAIHAVRPGFPVRTIPLDPRRPRPLTLRMEPGVRYVVDAGSLARPSLPGRRASLDRGTYAAIDLDTRTLALHAFSKKERLAALMKEVVAENTRKAREKPGP